MSDQPKMPTGAPATPEEIKDREEALKKVEATPAIYGRWIDDSHQLVGTIIRDPSGVMSKIQPVQFNHLDAMGVAAVARRIDKKPDVFPTLREFAYYFIELLCRPDKKGLFMFDVELGNLAFDGSFTKFDLDSFSYLVKEIAEKEGKLEIIRNRFRNGDVKLIIFSRKHHDPSVGKFISRLGIPDNLVSRFSKNGLNDSQIYSLPDNVRNAAMEHFRNIGYVEKPTDETAVEG